MVLWMLIEAERNLTPDSYRSVGMLFAYHSTYAPQFSATRLRNAFGLDRTEPECDGMS